MRFHRFVTIAALSGLLAACQSMTPEERRAADESTCASYGFRPKTDAMARCLLDIELDRRAESRSFQARNDYMLRSPIIVERRVVVERR